MRYADKLQRRIAKTGSRLCVGLDPRPGDGGASFARNFLHQVIEETALWAAAFKPNMAYFEAMGIEGIRLLEDLLATMPEDVPVILDAKRSDIGETQKYYAQGYFAGWNVDAVTLNPYLGRDSIQPFLEHADKGVILLCRTSNSGGADFQALDCGGAPLYLRVAETVARDWNANGNCALVTGATWPEELGKVRAVVGDMPLLVPGIGAQGGDVEAVLQHGRTAAGHGLMISSSRAILYAGHGEDFALAARAAASELRDTINRHRRR